MSSGQKENHQLDALEIPGGAGSQADSGARSQVHICITRGIYTSRPAQKTSRLFVEFGTCEELESHW